MAFWERVEERLVAFRADRARMARAMLVAYWISTAVVVLGAVIILLTLTGRLRL